jgi:hypothetical protein
VSTSRDAFDAEFGRAVATSQVDAELARMKAELPPGTGRSEEPPGQPS